MNEFWICLPLAAIILMGLVSCESDKLQDVDGNKYITIAVGSQVWMAGDLKTTRFNDGTPIPQVTKNDEWADLASPAFSWYNNDSTHKEDYGALYNWYAVSTGKLCPEGWHVPSDEEWNELVSGFGGLQNAGGALKETGNAHWRNPNTGAADEIGFTALPGGYRSYNGTFNLLRASGYWWSSTETNWYGSGADGKPSTVIFWNIRYKSNELFRFVSEKGNGFCVRCVMDQ